MLYYDGVLRQLQSNVFYSYYYVNGKWIILVVSHLAY